MSKEQQHKGINEVKTVIDNKSDEIVLIIDGENINKKEIEFVDFKMNTNEGNEDVIKRIIEDYVILKNAEETGEVLSKEEVEEKYVRDLLNCSIIDRNSKNFEIDKIMFIYKYGSKKARKIAVDEKLKMI